MADDFTSVVEQATGREVRVFPSETNIDHDVSVETFLLAAETHRHDGLPGCLIRTGGGALHPVRRSATCRVALHVRRARVRRSRGFVLLTRLGRTFGAGLEASRLNPRHHWKLRRTRHVACERTGDPREAAVHEVRPDGVGERAGSSLV
jgi:hypothetical protein